MKKQGFSAEQIAAVLKQVKMWLPVKHLIRQAELARSRSIARFT